MSDIQFYFLSDQYYVDFPDKKLMQNKDMINGSPHDRPCFFAFADKNNPEIYWIIPVSTQIKKYKQIAEYKIKKYGRCNNICFGIVLGKENAFLIQNMCPATSEYLTPYIDKKNHPVRIDERLAAEVVKNARDVMAMAKQGLKVIFPDVFKIYHSLEQQVLKQKQVEASEPEEPVKHRKMKL